jgi:hypothetical protein
MDGEAIVSVSAAVVACVQLIKWAGLRDNYGPIAVMALALFGTVFWGWSQDSFSRVTAFAYFAGWVAVTTSAAGVYGFTRAGGNALSRMTAPPSTGAGSEPTTKG